MNWILKYRTDPEYFNDTDIDKSKKLKEILRFIKNHDLNSISIIRDMKISAIIDDGDHEDPLDFLNPIIDILLDKIEKTMDLPSEILAYIDSSGNYNHEFIKADHIIYESLKEMEDSFQSRINYGLKLYPYTIFQDVDNKNIYHFRGTFIKSDYI